VTVFVVLAEVTLRALLGRRRTILLLLLAGLPVLVGLLARVGGGRLGDVAEVLDAMIVRIVLPLTALVFGTSALGSELEDGTIVYVLAKPIPRWQVIAAKLFVVGLLSSGLTVASAVLTGLLVGGVGATSLGTTFAFAVAGAVAAFAYVAIFVAASAVTSRALIVGLAYTLIWEGLLAGILEGTRIFSIREATIGIAGALAPVASGVPEGLDLGAAVVLVVVALAGGAAVAAVRLAEYEVRGTD